MNAHDIFPPYATVALCAIQELLEIDKKLELPQNNRTKAILKKQQSGMVHLIDRCFRLTGDFIPVSVSARARQYVIDNDLGDIFTIGWNEQPEFEKQVNRNTCQLKHEHKRPIGDLVKLAKNAKTLDELVKLFESQEIVWVHKEEDKKLPKTNRTNPDEDYAMAGIEIIKNPHPIGHLFK